MCTKSDTEVIYSYTREQALADGELVDLTEWASATKGFLEGFNCPVVVTRALWAAIEAIPESCKGIQDVRGRAHDVLFLASIAARRALKSEQEFARFAVHMGVLAEREKLQHLCICVHGGDHGEPVVTIGYPDDF